MSKIAVYYKVVAPVTALRFLTWRDKEAMQEADRRHVMRDGNALLVAAKPERFRSPLLITRNEMECVNLQEQARIQRMDRKPWDDSVIYEVGAWAKPNEGAEPWLTLFSDLNAAQMFRMKFGYIDPNVRVETDWRIYVADAEGGQRYYDEMCKCACVKATAIRITHAIG